MLLGHFLQLCEALILHFNWPVRLLTTEIRRAHESGPLRDDRRAQQRPVLLIARLQPAALSVKVPVPNPTIHGYPSGLREHESHHVCIRGTANANNSPPATHVHRGRFHQAV